MITGVDPIKGWISTEGSGRMGVVERETGMALHFNMIQRILI